MSFLPSQPATDLRTAYRVCDVKPLEGDDLDRYYAQLGEARKNEAMINISTMLDLQEEQEFSTILFTGHRGCGKSTELRLLERNWRSQYHVIYLETDEVTDINDVEYTDLYLLVAQYVEYELRKLGIQLDRGILKDFEDWFADITEETEQTVESSISLEGEVTLGGESPFPIPFLAKLLAKLTSQIKGGAKDKKVIRNTLEKDFSRLKATINLLLDDATKKLKKKRPDCKGLLLIFDNLDRCPPQVAKRLFFDYASQLQELRATVVYTVPISVLYSPLGIGKNFGQSSIVPMVNIYEFERDRDELALNDKGLQALVQLLQRRMQTDKIFASETVLLDVVRASGGHVRHLMQMMREACITAIGRGHKAIESDDAAYAIKQLQFSFEREIPDIHYAAIANTYRSKRAANDETGQQTLFNTSVLEYNGKQRWNYPHPTVMQIDAFQRAVNAIGQH
jgi:energy-coupling factor transporter ATP-binding protein EcfA2